MDTAKLIDLLYEVLPYVQKGEQFETKEKSSPDVFQRWGRRGKSVSVRVWETIKTLEKWESN